MSRKPPTKSPAVHAWGWRLLRHPLTTMSLAVALLVALTDACWQEFRDDVVVSRQLSLTPEKVRFNPPPEFYAEDYSSKLREEIAAGQPLLIEPALLSQVVTRLERYPGIHGINNAQKTATGLVLDLSYREPVGKMELAPQRYWVIDQTGTVLSSGHSPQQPSDAKLDLEQLLRIELRSLAILDQKSPGDAWQDELIVQAAAICEQLHDHWQRFKMFQLVSFCPPGATPSERLPWELWTRNGSKIIWSSDLSKDAIPVSQKLSALARWIEENGPLTQIPLDQALDIRSGNPQLVPWQRPIR